MRGLTQYIADLRACRVRELEEKRINKEMAHIRQKFKEGSLDGYQKKKYLSKVSLQRTLDEAIISSDVSSPLTPDRIHIHPRLPRRHWTHGSRKPHLQSKIL